MVQFGQSIAIMISPYTLSLLRACGGRKVSKFKARTWIKYESVAKEGEKYYIMAMMLYPNMQQCSLEKYYTTKTTVSFIRSYHKQQAYSRWLVQKQKRKEKLS